MLTIQLSVVCPRGDTCAGEDTSHLFWFLSSCIFGLAKVPSSSFGREEGLIYADITEAPPFHMDPRGCGNHTCVNLQLFRRGPFSTRRVVKMGGHLKLGKWRLTWPRFSIWNSIDNMKRNGVDSKWFKEAVRFLTDFLNWLNSSLPLFSQHHQPWAKPKIWWIEGDQKDTRTTWP